MKSRSREFDIVLQSLWNLAGRSAVQQQIGLSNFRWIRASLISIWHTFRGLTSRVTRHESLLTTRDSWIKLRVAIASGEPTSRDSVIWLVTFCNWLADLICGSRIAKHAKSRVMDSESRVTSHQSRFVTWSQVTSHNWWQVMVFIVVKIWIPVPPPLGTYSRGCLRSPECAFKFPDCFFYTIDIE